jgi:hypothetical protein
MSRLLLFASELLGTSQKFIFHHTHTHTHTHKYYYLVPRETNSEYWSCARNMIDRKKDDRSQELLLLLSHTVRYARPGLWISDNGRSCWLAWAKLLSSFAMHDVHMDGSNES